MSSNIREAYSSYRQGDQTISIMLWIVNQGFPGVYKVEWLPTCMYVDYVYLTHNLAGIIFMKDGDTYKSYENIYNRWNN